jgi:hypothetical protein
VNTPTQVNQRPAGHGLISQPELVHASARAWMFRALDEGGRAVALQVPRRSLAQDEGALGRWRGARAARPLLEGEAWGLAPFPWQLRPWLEGWTLDELRARLRSEGRLLPLGLVFGLASSLGSRLDELHALGQVHGRLCDRRVLLAPDGQVRLLGLGVSFGQGLDLSPTELSTVPPEELLGRSAGRPGDVYRLALLVLELACGGSHLLRGTREGTRERVLRGLGRVKVPGADHPTSLYVREALELDPGARPIGALGPVYRRALQRSPSAPMGLRELLGELFPGGPGRRPQAPPPEAQELAVLLEAAPLVAGPPAQMP